MIASYKLLSPSISYPLYIYFLLFLSLSLSPALVTNTWSTGPRARFSSKRDTGVYRNQVKQRTMKEWEHLTEVSERAEMVKPKDKMATEGSHQCI